MASLRLSPEASTALDEFERDHGLPETADRVLLLKLAARMFQAGRELEQRARAES